MKLHSEVVRTLDFEPFVWAKENYRLRLEVAKLAGGAKFVGRVSKLKRYQLQPAEPAYDGLLPDEKDFVYLYVQDDRFTASLEAGSIEGVFDKFDQAFRVAYPSCSNGS